MKIPMDEYVAGLESSDVLAEQTDEQPVVAFFDLDRTLIDGYSLTALAWQELFDFRLSVKRFFKLGSMFAKYGLGRISYAEMLEATIDDIKGTPEDDLVTLAERAFDQRLKSWIYQEGFDLVASHRAQGHHVVLVTSATSYQVSPLTRIFEFDEIYCTELEMLDGRVAGGVSPCFGAGKLIAARDYCDKVGGDLKQSYFYSDSADDMPLLEQVGYPVVCNGRESLLRHAQDRGWPSLDFNQPYQDA